MTARGFDLWESQGTGGAGARCQRMLRGPMTPHPQEESIILHAGRVVTDEVGAAGCPWERRLSKELLCRQNSCTEDLVMFPREMQRSGRSASEFPSTRDAVWISVRLDDEGRRRIDAAPRASR